MDINAKINKRNAERLLDELMDECKRIGYEHAEDELKSLRAKVETLRREREELLAAAVTVRADLVRRAEFDSEDGGAVLNISNGVLMQLDAAIAKVKP